MNNLKKPSMVWAYIFFGLLTVAFFYQTVFLGKIPVPTDTLVGLYHPWRDLYAPSNPRGVPFKNFLITDPVRQQIPWRKVGIDQWKNGHMPTWNAYSFVGTRLDNNIQAAVYYPMNFIFLLLNFQLAWTLLVMVQPFVAGIGLFFYLRYHRLSTIAAVFGAISWAFGGFSIAWLTWGTILQTAMWVPMLLLSLDHLIKPRIEKNEEIRWMCAFWIIVFLLLSAGHSQIALYGLMVSGAYAARLFTLGRYPHQIQKALASRLILLGLVSGFITMPIWWPQLSTLAQTARAVADTHPVGWFLPWQNLIQFIAPDYFGNPATMNYWGIWNYGEFVGYIGIISLIFAGSAIFSGSIATFWSLIFIGSLFFMLPHPITYVFGAMKLPLLGSLQPTRLMMPVVLALCVLAAYGVDGWRRSSKRVILVITCIGVIMACLWCVTYFGSTLFSISDANIHVALRNLIIPTGIFMVSVVLIFVNKFISKPRQVYILLILLVLSTIEVFRFGWKFTPFTDTAYFFPKTSVIEYLQKQPRPFRVASIDDRVLPSNALAYYEIESVDGYDPLALLRYENFLTASERNKPDLTRPTGFNRIYTAHNVSSSLFPLFSAQYIVSIDTLNKPGLTLVFEEGETKVYKNTLAFPRVYLAEQIDVAMDNNDQNILAKVFMGMNQSKPAVVEKAIPVLSLPLTGDESVSITSYKADSMTIQSRTVNPRLLVVLNSYDGGWQATVDGKPTPIDRVNYLFFGLVVPTGSHEVKLIHK